MQNVLVNDISEYLSKIQRSLQKPEESKKEDTEKKLMQAEDPYDDEMDIYGDLDDYGDDGDFGGFGEFGEVNMYGIDLNDENFGGDQSNNTPQKEELALIGVIFQNTKNEQI